MPCVDHDFQIIETLRLEPNGNLPFLPDHLLRMETSAAELGFRFSRSSILHALQDALRDPKRSTDSPPLKLRILLSPSGEAQVTSSFLEPVTRDPKVTLSSHRIHSANPFLCHKTTRREVYESEFSLWSQKTGCFDVLFLNERDELTEGSRSNLFLRIADQWVTPPLSCGVLPGVMRAHLLKEWKAEEKSLRMIDLERAEKIVLSNAVRGPTEVAWMPPTRVE